MKKKAVHKAVPKPELAKAKYSDGYISAFIVGIVGFLLYINTIGHGFVLDDNNAIKNNLFVQQGISGIPKLFTVDFWYFENVKLGYYQPLSLVTFAVEHEFFGNNAHVGHIDNAILYGLTGFVLCLLLLQLFAGKHPAFAFLISLVFIAHPIHTEVVANIKSRDEILSFLNMIAMIFFAFKYGITKKRADLVWSLIFFYLALLSKETAVVGIILLPLFLYYTGIKIPDILKKLVPFAAVAIFFFAQKRYFLGSDSVNIPNDIINYPYIGNKVKIPTSFHIFTLCLERLVFPWPLSHDYSYNEIPASRWSNGGATLGLVLFAALAVIGIRGLLKKTFLGLGVSVIFITLIPSVAFIYLRGGIMAERFLYAPSLGFAMLVVYALMLAFSKSDQIKINMPAWIKSNSAITGIVVIIFLAYSIETIGRNKAWKDEMTLYATDSKNSPNSCQVHMHYGIALLTEGGVEKDTAKRKQDFETALVELEKAVAIHPAFGKAYFEMGMGYQIFETKMDSAIKYYKKCIELDPGYALPYYNIGHIYESQGRYELASYYYNKSVEANPQFQEGIKSVADIKKSKGLNVQIPPSEDVNPQTEVDANKSAANLPESEKFDLYTKQGTSSVNKGDFMTGIEYFKKAAAISPTNKQNLIYLANSYGMAKQYQNAVNTFELILKNDPGDQTVLKNLALTYDWMGEKDKGDEVRKRLK